MPAEIAIKITLQYESPLVVKQPDSAFLVLWLRSLDTRYLHHTS